jgi:hypothetical protein
VHLSFLQQGCLIDSKKLDVMKKSVINFLLDLVVALKVSSD